jgi:hypothetical protein
MPVPFVLDGLPLLFREFESPHLYPPNRARPIVPMNVQHRFLRAASFEIIFSHRIQGNPKLNVSFVHGYGILEAFSAMKPPPEFPIFRSVETARRLETG